MICFEFVLKCHLHNFLKEEIGKVIGAKKSTIARFNGDHNMWIGADYWPVDGKWKWRNAYVGFDGIHLMDNI